MFGVTQQAVSAWKDCPRNADRSYSLPVVVAWKLQRLRDELELEADQGDNGESTERWRKARAERAEIEVARMKGELVSLSDVESKWGRVLSHIIQAFDGLGKVLAPRLARRDEKEIAGTIRDEVHRAIETARNSMLQDGEI